MSPGMNSNMSPSTHIYKKPEKQVISAHDFGRVALVFGGDSSEREVSLDSGSAVLVSLQQQGVKAMGIDGIPALSKAISLGRIDRVFNILHGTDGEDGVLQGLLEASKIPYTGSGVLGSALAMDKARSKQIWQQMQLPTADYLVLENSRKLSAEQQEQVQQWLPVVVKPNQQGSTVGISVVQAIGQLSDAINDARQYDDCLLIERYIQGDDYTVAFVQQSVFPSVRIRPEQGFYDYYSKYQSDTTRYDTDTLDEDQETAMRDIAMRASVAVGVTGWGRVDFMRDQQGKIWLLEVNTVPGMTSHSLVPKAAAAADCSYDELTWAILETSMPVSMPGPIQEHGHE